MSETQDLRLVRDPETSALCLTDGKLRMQGDLAELKHRLKPNNLNGEMLVKASGIKKMIKKSPQGDFLREEDRPLLLDATAGMGEDSLILAAAGFRVLMYEYDPVIAALLEDSLRRAAEDPDLGAIVARMSLVNGDSISAMIEMKNRMEAEIAESEEKVRTPDVIFLDPMFPERRKTGLIKKKFQLLQQLERPCSEDIGEVMLRAAMDLKPQHVMVKRPANGPFLAGLKSAYSLDGKAVRYDVY